MKVTIALALLLNLSVGAFGTSCSPGFTHKKTLTGLTCASAATDAKSCNTNCCEADVKTCGGLNVACGAGKYNYATKAGATAKAIQVVKDAWAATAATEATKLTSCCTAVAKCVSGGYTCTGGTKRGTGAPWEATACTSDAASCATSAGCCIADTTTCGGSTAQTCDAGTKLGTDDAWKSTKVVDGPGNAAADWKASCCGTLPTCASKFYSCPDGQKRTADKTTSCSGSAPSTCATTTACCTKDNTKCGGQVANPTCSADKYYPTSLAGANVGASATTNCCATKATCAVATCKSGYTKKANVDTLSCTTDAASCATGTTCCQKDVTKCGGLTAIACATGFYLESANWVDTGDANSIPPKTTQATKDAWNNKPATEATKNTACCTAKAVCTNTTVVAVAAGVTTTPAAVVTTTPAAPALKFSEHKVAIAQGTDQPWASNMALLGVGGLIGMSVLAAVQGLRSRMQPAREETQAREVDSLLDNGNLE